jgi:ABC-type multidrug transport system fused ATPase/permease subunit
MLVVLLDRFFDMISEQILVHGRDVSKLGVKNHRCLISLVKNRHFIQEPSETTS